MSRTGSNPIPIPANVQVTVADDNTVTVSSAKGELQWQARPAMIITVDEQQVVINRPNDQKQFKALHGLTRALIANMIEGVSEGFEKRLELQGVGYRAEMEGSNLRLRVGFSHDVVITPPAALEVATEGTGTVTVRGIDKQAVGQLAASIRAVRPVGPYWAKGQRWAGIKYSDEEPRRKAGKQAKIGVD